jgi:predicted exporter
MSHTPRISSLEGKGQAPTWLVSVARIWGAILLFSLCYTGWSVWQGVALESDLLKLLPKDEQQVEVEAATDIFLREVGQRVMILVRAKDFASSSTVAQRLSSKLLRSGYFSRVEAQQGVGVQQKYFDLYFPYRLGLYSESLQKAFLAPDPASAIVRRMYQILSSPVSGGVGQYIEDDPFLLFSEFLSSLRKSVGSLQIRDGYLITVYDGVDYVMVQGVLSQNVFNRDFQKKVSGFLAELQVDLHSEFPELDYVQFGALEFAAEMAGQAEHDVFVIGVGSVLGIVLLLIVVFRSPFPFLVTTGTICAGLLVAFTTSTLIFEALHGLALAFGASLIGVCTDYSLHFFCHRSERSQDSALVLRRVLPGITLGMLTTALGYFALLSVPFPGLYQMAFFSIAGMIATFITVGVYYRWIPPASERDARSLETLYSACDRYIVSLLAFWKSTYGILTGLLFLILVVWGLFGLTTNDNVRALQTPPPHLVEAERKISASTGGVDKGRFILTCGSSVEEMLVQEEQVAKSLNQIVASGDIEGFQGLSRFVPSTARQRQRAKAVQSALTSSRTQIEAGLIDLGYEPNGLKKVLSDIQEQEFRPLELSHWLESSASVPLRFLYLPLPDLSRHCSMIILQGVHSLEALDALVDKVSGSFVVDLIRDSTRVLKIYRESATRSILWCYLVVAVVLCLRYGIVTGLLALLPAGGALISTLSLYGFLSIPLTLFSVLANAIVLGLAVDYSIFLLEEKGRRGKVVLAIFLSGISSILSFGLLGLSQAAVLQSLGITLFCGVFFTVLFCPLVIIRKR